MFSAAEEHFCAYVKDLMAKKCDQLYATCIDFVLGECGEMRQFYSLMRGLYSYLFYFFKRLILY